MMRVLPFLSLIATLAFVLSPLVTEPFSGFERDQFPIPQIDPPVQPAGYAFGIWGLIYLWLVVSAIYGAAARRDDAGLAQDARAADPEPRAGGGVAMGGR